MNSPLKRIRSAREISSIELLRGIASAMVCYFHLARGNERYLPDTSIVRRMGDWGWTGVEIFFVISGFVIPYSMFVKNYSAGNFLAFLKKRIIRIEPPYLISIVLVVILNFVSTLSPYYRGAPFSVDWANIAGHIAYLNVFTGGKWLNPVYWSLAIEFQYYLLIAVVFGVIVSPNRYLRLSFFVLFSASSLILTPFVLFDNSPLWMGPYDRVIFTYAPFFMLGILLFQWVCEIISKTEFLIMTSITVGLVFFKNGWELTFIVLVAMLMIIYVDKVPAFLKYLGLISYSLYLIHVPVGGRIINIAEVKVHSVFLRECIVFVSFAVCLAASALFYKYIERPFKKISGAIRYGRSPDSGISVKIALK